MKIAVIGVGAMGSVYAGLLAAAGEEVWALDRWAEHLQAIRDHGLRLEDASGDRVVRSIRVADAPDEVGPCDLVIIATKAEGVASAAASIGPLLGPETMVLSIQNGLGAGDRLRAALPAERLLLGVAGGFGASIIGPGHAHHNGMELIRLGELAGGLSERVERMAQVWRDAGFTAKAYADIDQLVWEKFVCNVAFSAPCTVFGRSIGAMMADPLSRGVSLGCGREAHAAGRARGVNFSFSDPDAYIAAFAAAIPNAKPSVLLDHLARRRSEIDWINGMVPVVSAEHDLRAPYNEVVTAVVKAREAEF